jgi:uncharacterized coiled-coil protein SlyX
MTRADTMSEEYDSLEKRIHELELQIAVNEMLPSHLQMRPAIARMREHLECLRTKRDAA